VCDGKLGRHNNNNNNNTSKQEEDENVIKFNPDEAAVCLCAGI